MKATAAELRCGFDQHGGVREADADAEPVVGGDEKMKQPDGKKERRCRKRGRRAGRWRQRFGR